MLYLLLYFKAFELKDLTMNLALAKNCLRFSIELIRQEHYATYAAKVDFIIKCKVYFP